MLARPLPAATEAFRPPLAAVFARWNAAGAPHGRRFGLLTLKPASAGKVASLDVTITPGDRGFASWSLGAMASNLAAWAPPFSLRTRFSDCGSYVGPIDAAAVRALLTLADRASLSLSLLVSSLLLHFEMARLRWCCWEESPASALLTRDGATLLLRALLLHLTSPRDEAPPPLSPRLADGEIAPLTLAEVTACVTAMNPTRCHAFESLLVLVLALESLPAEDHGPLVAWGQEHVARGQDYHFGRGWQMICARVAQATHPRG